MDHGTIDAILKGDAEVFEVDPVSIGPTDVEPTLLLKATPKTEGDRRLLYIEPSNENWDSENERVLQKALAESKSHYLKHGNIDLNHLTLFGWKMGIDNPHLWEIGVPVDVVVEPRILVKGEIYRGSGISAEKANFFWASLTEQDPPQNWYPSVGGIKPAKQDAGHGRKIVSAVTWNNIGLAKLPVNRTVVPVSTMAPAEFAKAVVAGYGTDSATLTGGAALRRQSLEGVGNATQDHRIFKAVAGHFLAHLGLGTCEHTLGVPTLAKITAHFRDCEGCDEQVAKAYADRVLADAALRTSPAHSTHFKQAA